MARRQLTGIARAPMAAATALACGALLGCGGHGSVTKTVTTPAASAPATTPAPGVGKGGGKGGGKH